VPTKLLAAEHDVVSDPTTMTAMAARLPDATLVIARGAAHLSPFHGPQRLARYLGTGEW
jgi:pimeloyl-ACP methyl ester carboxylesterase